MPSYVHPCIYTTLCTPGYTTVPTVSVLSCTRLGSVRVDEALGSHPGIIREDEAQRGLPSPLGVRKDGSLCAESSALSAQKEHKDWIDEG